VKPDPPDQTARTDHPPARPITDGYRFYFVFFFSGFRQAMDFMILIGYPPDPPDHLNIIPIKKKPQFSSLPHHRSLSLFLSPSRCSASQALPITLLCLKLYRSRCSISSSADHMRSQALPISPSSVLTLSDSLSLPQSSLSAALSLPPSVSGSSAYGGHKFLVVPNQVRPHWIW
jgi:hypothetical protein